MPNAGDRGGRPPSFEEIQDLVDQRAPRRIVVSDPGWLSCFRCQLRSTTSYRRGRVLLAGDAAHVHSPAGGQGMNTGMMDAGNLAWKLALVTDGAPESLLDTYEQERVPVASSVLGFTDRLVGWATMRHPVKRALRDTLIPGRHGPAHRPEPRR
jgi:2-polyprenyl-6-methoxyphenol hydroxylase-like FAD-dependent oxidoreductase